MEIIRFFLYVAAGLMLGHWLGKGAIDSLVDSNIKGCFGRCAIAVCSVAGLALLAMADAVLRINWIAMAVSDIGGFVFGFFFYILCNPVLGLRVKWNDETGKIIPDLVFDAECPETGYDLYLPTKKSEDGTYALILYIHGGGFSGGDKKDGAVWCKYMTAKGFVSVSMNYTLLKPEYSSNLHLMAAQAMKCVEAVRKKCNEIGYPVTEMAVTGGSAGGAIALLFAYGTGTKSPVPIKFVFEQTGPVFFDPVMWGTVNYAYELQAISISAFSGENITPEMVKNGEHYAYIEDMSPASLVKDSTVPTLCAYGPRDKTVPAQLKYLLFSALERHRVPYDYIEYRHSNHGLYDDPKAQREFLKKLDEYCDRYFEHVRRR